MATSGKNVMQCQKLMFLKGSAYFLATVVTSIKGTYYLCTSVLERREYSPLPSYRTLLTEKKEKR